jgi:hypothetical protein
MVLIALAELGLRITWWTVKGAFSVGKYLIYGREKTDQEKIAELQNELKELKELKEKLKEKEEEKEEEKGEEKKEVKEEEKEDTSDTISDSVNV